MGRMRNIPQAKQLIQESPFLLKNKVNVYEKAIVLEVGIGKGGFILQAAKTYKQFSFIGIEKNATAIYKLINKIGNDDTIKNLSIINDDFANIDNWLDKNTVDMFFVNFPDPWPKKRHEKRRLFSNEFIELFRGLARPGALLQFRTDNHDLYLYVKEQLKKKWKLTNKNKALSLFNNIKTEYQQKFTSQGNKIYILSYTII